MALQRVLTDQQVTSSEILVVGVSIGTGVASYLASEHSLEGVLLFTPYTSIPGLLEDMPLLGYLTPFLWHTFPTDRYLNQSSTECIVLVHGEKDSVIPISHSESLYRQLQDEKRVALVRSDKENHNTILDYTRDRVEVSL